MFDAWPILEPLAALLAALVLEKLLPEPVTAPWRAFRRLASNLELKVNRDPQAPSSQQTLAGALALALLLLPIPLLALSLPRLLDPPLVLHTLMLWLALVWTPIRRDARRIAEALDKGEREAARSLLQRWVLRETRAMSDIGLAKTTVEMLLLRLVRGRLSVLVWFLLLGPAAALVCRANWELTHSWSCKSRKTHYFGRAAARLQTVLEAPAVWLTILLLRLRPPQPITIEEAHAPIGRHSGRLLRHAAASLHLRLGGPAIYDGRKLRRPRYNSGGEPTAASIRETLALLRLHQGLWLSLIVLGYLLYALAVA